MMLLKAIVPLLVPVYAITGITIALTPFAYMALHPASPAMPVLWLAAVFIHALLQKLFTITRQERYR